MTPEAEYELRSLRVWCLGFGKTPDDDVRMTIRWVIEEIDERLKGRGNRHKTPTIHAETTRFE